MEKLKLRLREKILKNEYCKFDLLPMLFPLDYLLREKPLVLREKIALNLNIEPAKINAKAFNQWRRRLRLKLKEGQKPMPAPKHPKIFNPTHSADPENDYDPFNPIPSKEEIDDYCQPAKRPRHKKSNTNTMKKLQHNNKT